MGREIQFRVLAQDPKTDEYHWIYSTDYGLMRFFRMIDNGVCKEETLGQWTGLVDRNNKEIYEGDILQYEDSEGWTHDFVEPVIWNEKHQNHTESSAYVFYEAAKLSQVIGNLYESPELLTNEPNEAGENMVGW